MFELPTSIKINDKEFPIRKQGDYRVILDCFEALDDPELDEQFRVYTSLIIFYEDINTIEDIVTIFQEDVDKAVIEMFKFFNCGQDDSPGATTNVKLINWSKDSQLIVSAINNVAKKEIRAEPYLHWWTFMGYYLSVGDSPFSTIVGIRDKLKRGKKLEKYEQEFKRNNPQYFNWDSRSVLDKQLEDDVRALWNSGQ